MQDVFSYRDEVIKEYQSFSRSFTNISAPDIKAVVDKEYEEGRYWPEPLIQINPNYKTDKNINELCDEGTLESECRSIFQVDKKEDGSGGKTMTLYSHQQEAISFAAMKQSYVVTTGTEATEIAKGNLDDSYGTKRMYIWKRTVEIVPKHIWHGVGVDSFHKAFDGKALIRKTKTKAIIYDKAHNEYLQLLITQGIFSLIAYLSLCGYVLFCGLHRSIKHNELYLVLPVIGYLVQAFFNISVIEVAPIFWLAMGLCCGKKE